MRPTSLVIALPPLALAIIGCGATSVLPSRAAVVTVAPAMVATAQSAPALPTTSPSITTATSGPPSQSGTILFPLEYGEEGANGSQLFTVRADGTGLTQLTDLDLGFATSAAWTPDHRDVLFELGHPDPNVVDARSHIAVVGFAGGDVTALTHGKVIDSSPTVSPDGRHVVFARSSAVKQDPAQPSGWPWTPWSLYQMNIDGSGIRRLTHGSGEDGDTRPKYAPDGTRILFTRNGAVAVMQADGSGIREVVGSDAGAEVANWSPDGSRIVYHDANRGTAIVAAAGGTPTIVEGVGDPSWSPDGSAIVGTYWREGLHSVGIASMRPDGSDIQILWHPEVDKDIFPQTPVWIGEP